jgi:lysophospholipase L1-like esterase
MNNCFGLRFNLQKCGYDFGEKTEVFAEMFGQDKAFIEETLQQYDEINTKSAEKIIAEYDMSKLDYLKNKKIMLFGDSNTSDRISFGKILEKVLPCQVIDGAVSGWRSVQILSEIDRMLLVNKPDIAVIQIGTNDAFFCDKEAKVLCTSKEEYVRNLECIIEKVKSKGIKVIVNSLPLVYCEKMARDHAFWTQTYENIENFNAIAQTCAEKAGVSFFDSRDVFSNFNDYEELFYNDGVHLTSVSHALIAEKFVRFLGENYGNN